MASARSSTCKNSRSGDPDPHTTTSFAPVTLASWNRLIRAGNTCEFSGWKLSCGPYKFVGIPDIASNLYCNLYACRNMICNQLLKRLYIIHGVVECYFQQPQQGRIKSQNPVSLMYNIPQKSWSIIQLNKLGTGITTSLSGVDTIDQAYVHHNTSY